MAEAGGKEEATDDAVDVVDLSMKLYIEGTSRVIDHLTEEVRELQEEVRYLKKSTPVYVYQVSVGYDSYIVATRKEAVTQCRLHISRYLQQNRFEDVYKKRLQEFKSLDETEDFPWNPAWAVAHRVSFKRANVTLE